MEYVVPDSIGNPISAWRVWFVVPADKTSGELKLRSFVYMDIWEHAEPHEAQCRASASGHRADEKWIHEAPHKDHSCGIYGVKEAEELDRYYRNGAYEPGSWMEIWRVIGKVGLWGKVVPAERGYRAQYAYPTKIQIPARIEGRERHLSANEVALALEHYECEIEIVDDTLDLRRDHPLRNPLV